MHTLHDHHTICDKVGYQVSLLINKTLDELEQAREEGDEYGVKMLELALSLILEQVEPIEE
tara:strand:+ start:175 stop:357 length:183 start_codon:yes stop_codon:yes gene_type:complete